MYVLLDLDIPNHSTHHIHHQSPRYFYIDAIAKIWAITGSERGIIVALVVIGYLISLLLRIFLIAIILIPFFGLMHHARREDGVGDVRGGPELGA